MNINPYNTPESARAESDSPPEGVGCPDCRAPMEEGFIAMGGKIYWLASGQNDLVLFPSSAIPGSGPGIIRTNKMRGYRCQSCEVIVFRFGGRT